MTRKLCCVGDALKRFAVGRSADCPSDRILLNQQAVSAGRNKLRPYAAGHTAKHFRRKTSFIAFCSVRRAIWVRRRVGRAS